MQKYAPKTSLETETPCDKHRVLIVDDDPAILFAYAKILEREGLCVDSCDCLIKAIKHIRSHTYLAVISDMQLIGTENTDGLDVRRTLQSERLYSHVIIATGSGNSDIEQSVCQMGASHYFQKPVDPSLILAAIMDLKAAIHTDKLPLV
jgi:DNA-binding NtrC family response regulator